MKDGGQSSYHFYLMTFRALPVIIEQRSDVCMEMTWGCRNREAFSVIHEYKAWNKCVSSSSSPYSPPRVE